MIGLGGFGFGGLDSYHRHLPTMARTFNTAGPCLPGWHYMLPPERRMPGVRDVIDEMQYFVIHAPRQTGKTTALQALALRLTEEGRYAAVLVTAEMGAAFPRDVGKAELAMLSSWAADAAHQLPPELRPPAWTDALEGSRVQAALAAWAQACPRPLVVFIELDAAHRKHSNVDAKSAHRIL